jgi:hypothetical protein
MAIVVNQAPVAFSAFTSASGTSAQTIPVSSTGVTAGVAAGNLYLDAAPSNLLNGRRFQVSVGGWVKAHGATQTFAPGLQIYPWNTTVAGAKTASGTATFTPVASGTLVAGTFYDFVITQEFFGEANANTLTCFAPSVYVAGTQVTISSVASAQTVAFASASQTEPITGINNTTDYPLASFTVTFTNSVSDTVETMQLTSFSLQVTV